MIDSNTLGGSLELNIVAAEIAKSAVEKIVKLNDLVFNYCNNGESELEKRYTNNKMEELKRADYDEYYDLLINYQDEQYEFDTMKIILNSLSIIYLYRIIELQTKKLCGWIYTENIVKTFFNFQVLMKQLKHKPGYGMPARNSGCQS